MNHGPFLMSTAKWRSWIAHVRTVLFTGTLMAPLLLVGRAPEDTPVKQGWLAVPESALERVCPPETKDYDFRGNCRNVIAAWNSAIADTKLDRLIIWGGGHSDYAGNEIYAFDLASSRMQRLNDPSPVNNTGKCVEMLSDGKPNSRHTYAGLSYIAYANHMFSFGGSLNQCGFLSNETWTLDLATLEWKNMKPEGGTPAASPGAIADYDPNSRMVFLHDTADFWQYDFEKNRYKRVGSNQAINYHMNGVIDPKRKLFLVIGAAGAAGGGLKAISIAPGSNYSIHDWTGEAASTCGPLLSTAYPGLAYDSALDRVVGWPKFGDTVYLLDPDAKSCTSVTFTGGPPDSSHAGAPHTSNGTYSRFRYFPDKNVFVLVNQTSSNVYLLTLGPSARAGQETKKN
jgi:hypothetical protein